jgi:O-antigen/teichoic acid export membrane protein
MANPIRKLAGQTAIYGLPSIVGRLLNYLLVPLHTYYFAKTADYGVISELYAWVAFLIVLLTFGMETAFFRFLQNEGDKEKAYNTAFWSVVGVNIVFYATLLFFNNDIANALLFEGHNEYVVLLGSIVMIDAITALPLAKLRAEEKALRFASIQMLSIGLNIGLNLIAMIFFFSAERPEEGILFILLANLVASLAKPILLYDHIFRVHFIKDWGLYKRMWIYAVPLVIAGFAGIINETFDRILLKHLLYDPAIPESLTYAESQVGIYSACYKLAMLVTIILQAYRYAAEPFFFRQMQNQDRNTVYVKVMNLFVAMVCAVFLMVSLNLDIFKHFIQKEAYWEGLKVVPILLIANVFLGIYYNQSIWYKLSGKTQYGAYITIAGAIVTIAINVYYIPKYQYMASAWATLIVYGLQMILSYFLGQKHFPIPYNLKKFFLYLGSSLVLFWIGSQVQFEKSILNHFVHNLLVLLFVGFVFALEKNNLKASKGH